MGQFELSHNTAATGQSVRLEASRAGLRSTRQELYYLLEPSIGSHTVSLSPFPVGYKQGVSRAPSRDTSGIENIIGPS